MDDAKKPKCKLVGTDGNVFAIIGTVSLTLKRAGLNARAAEFRKKAWERSSYDQVLALCYEYVEVQ
jgi:hypothetical protein